MRYPRTKTEAVFCNEENAKWGVPKPIGQALIHYFYDLGAKHDLPNDKIELVEYVKRFHKRMTVDNIHCPDDIPFDILYSSFCSAVLNGSIELPDYQPHATKNQLQAFKRWITQGNQLDRLYEKYYREYPEQRPKQLENESTKLENWPDHDIEKQYRTLITIFDKVKNLTIFDTSAADSYFNRIKNEYNKRFDDGEDLAEKLYG